MPTGERKNNNDLTTGDRLYDSGVGTDGAPLAEESPQGKPEAETIDSNYSTYAANATAEAVDAPQPRDP